MENRNIIIFDISKFNKAQELADKMHSNLKSIKGYNGLKYVDVSCHSDGKRCAVIFKPFKVLKWAEPIINAIHELGYGGTVQTFNDDWNFSSIN